MNNHKLNLGIIYRKANSWWNFDNFFNALKPFSDAVEIRLFDVTDFNETMIQSDLDSVALLPSETDVLQSFLDKNKKIRWVHSMFAGVDKFLGIKDIFDKDTIALTNSRGAFADSLSEFAIFSMLYFYYNSPLYFQLFKEKKWAKPLNKMIKGKTLTIVGYGSNGAVLAKKAKLGFDMNVIGVKKNITKVEGKEFVDEVYEIERLKEVLPKTDFLVNFLPHTPDTINFFNYEIFSQLPSTSVFINLGRGSAVVEEDLIKILKEKKILGASLDVTQQEPLSSDSPLFGLDNIYLSFHSCDNTEEYFMQAVEVFKKNLENYLNEGKFFSVVDKQKGY